MKKAVSTFTGILLMVALFSFKYFYLDAPKHETLSESEKVSDQQLEEIFNKNKETIEEVDNAEEVVAPVEKPKEEITVKEQKPATITFTEDDIKMAILSGDTNKLSSYLENGLDPDYIIKENTQLKDSLLTFAIGAGHNSIIKTLLEHGADPNFIDGGGIPAIAGATISRNKEAVELLLSYNANPNLTGTYKVTALEVALSQGYDELVPLLSR
ncbi:ankyrin repeat domain-containing protein [Neobacillus drentensis]|uniref:ankyrin repeat domain-containing protein n=1 Tax=Neobacillus drentensis TaxID=220684 RepID=UPI001F232DF2|nr:ankyrin repeat domain-containing protein [Neobacillus drentensis]ULT56754.1 ankyrin repeat domain-containing protein [Neobacillus drentensis]